VVLWSASFENYIAFLKCRLECSRCIYCYDETEILGYFGDPAGRNIFSYTCVRVHVHTNISLFGEVTRIVSLKHFNMWQYTSPLIQQICYYIGQC
jgi:hypothetical protein